MYSLIKGSRAPRTAALALGLTALVACGGTGGTTGSGGPAKASAAQQIWRVNSSVQPNSLDPGQQTYDYEGYIGRQVFEPLLKPTKDGKDLTGAAATGKPDISTDGLKYTFHLRDNNWSDGKPVKAADFVYGWGRLLNPCLAAGYADPFFDQTVKGADKYGDVDAKNTAACDTFVKGLGLAAPDDKTFVIQLQKPAGYFSYITSLWVAAPVRQDIVEKFGSDKWATVPAQVIGNGKFKISDLVPNDHITLVPNTQYKGDQPQIQKFIAYFISDANTALNKYKNGELDVIDVPLEATDAIKADPKLSKQYHVFLSLNNYWFNFNNKKAPFDNPKVRKAFAIGLDRQQLVSKVTHGQYKSETTFTPEGMPGYQGANPDLKDVLKFDAAAGKKLLTDAGVNPASLTVDLLTRDSTGSKLINQFIQEQWQTNLGVKVTLNVIDSKTVTKKLRKGDYQVMAADGWGMDYAHPQDIFDIEMSGGCHGTQFECYSSKTYDDLITKADAEKDFNKALDIYKQAEKLLLTDVPVGPIFQRPNNELVQPWVQNYNYTPLDSQYGPGEFYTEQMYISSH